MSALIKLLGETGGKLREQVVLAPLAWLRVGGPARLLWQPQDSDDLAHLLPRVPREIEVIPIGVASNMLIRDGGIDGLVIRFGGDLARVEVDGDHVVAGAGALDQRVAQTAMRAGLSGLEWMIGVPGTVGAAVRMNAGAFGGETADVLSWVEALDRDGVTQRLRPEELGFDYRRSALPADAIVLRAAFACRRGEPEAIAARMTAIRSERELAQPSRVATGGSTFKNPAGYKAWQLIDAAGCRGLRQGQAMVSEKHCNFLINLGGASSDEIESLGETVAERVRATSGIVLEWEIIRSGRKLSGEAAA